MKASMMCTEGAQNEAAQQRGFDDEKAEPECWNGCERGTKTSEVTVVDCLIVDEIFVQ